MRRGEIYDIRKHRVRYFFSEVWEWTKVLYVLGKRLALIGLISWGGIKYLTQNGRRSISEGIRAHTVETDFGKQVVEGLHIIGEMNQERKYYNSPQGKAERAAAQKLQQERIKEYKELGIDPVIHCVKPGDPGFKEEAEFLRSLKQDSR